MVPAMGLYFGGFHDRPDWPKIGPSLLIATCLILAIRTAKWTQRSDNSLSDRDLEIEIDFAAHMANRVLSKLMTKCEEIFPQKKEPWYHANDEDVRK
jgi:hypothetical protein